MRLSLVLGFILPGSSQPDIYMDLMSSAINNSVSG